MKKNCKECLKTFVAHYNKKYCSKMCFQRSRYKKNHDIYEAGKKILEQKDIEAKKERSLFWWPIIGAVAVIGIFCWYMFK